MKKTKLLSLLLSCSMIAASLPLVASAERESYDNTFIFLCQYILFTKSHLYMMYHFLYGHFSCDICCDTIDG